MKKRDIKTELKKVIKREVKASKMRLGIPQPPLIQNHFLREMTKLLRYNPNNIGTTTRMMTSEDSCRKLEKRLIKKLAGWFGDPDADGYVTSGSTEGNIMGLWIAREELKKYGKPIVIAHKESHYSIDKACRILDLELFKTNTENWKEPLNGKLLKEIIGDKKRPVICVATIGHTSTGIIDDVLSISNYLKENHKHIYLHLDAAIGGLFVTLTESQKIDFSRTEVQSITFDFHKYGLFYYPSGIFMCRKDLQSKIINKIDEYVSIFDDTLIGSRSGTIPAIMWANIEYLEKRGLIDRIDHIIKNKNIFIKELVSKKVRYISEERMPVVCFFLDKKIPDNTELKYRIHHIKRPEGYCYTIFFFPEYSDSYTNLLKSL